MNFLHVKLIDAFKQHVPNTTDFNVGYFEGPQHSKVWLVMDDLGSMYKKYHNGGDIALWCDAYGKADGEKVSTKTKGSGDSMAGSSRQEKEGEVELIYKDLKEEHDGNYNVPRLRLWARMIASDLHDDYDNPPSVPAFSGMTHKRPRKDDMYDAITGAAVAFAKAIGNPSKPLSEEAQSRIPSVAGLSPSMCIDLRMKNFEQLRYLQELYNDGILNDNEYMEQKENIIGSLRKIS